MLVDLRPMKTEGAMVEKVLEDAGIAVNKNTCPGDKSALRPSGLRLGTPALTSRGLLECHMEKVAEFIHRGMCMHVSCPGSDGQSAATVPTKFWAVR